MHRAFSSREDGEGAMKVAKLKIPTNNLASMDKGAFDVLAAAASKQSSLLPMATFEQSNDKVQIRITYGSVLTVVYPCLDKVKIAPCTLLHM